MILTLWNKPIDQTFNDSNFTLPNSYGKCRNSKFMAFYRNLLDSKRICNDSLVMIMHKVTKTWQQTLQSIPMKTYSMDTKPYVQSMHCFEHASCTKFFLILHRLLPFMETTLYSHFDYHFWTRVASFQTMSIWPFQNSHYTSNCPWATNLW